jgi:hypothetical protein
MDSGDTRFEIGAAVARNLAAACDRLVDDLQRARATEPAITTVTGFADLPSGHGLARGFAGKGREFLDTLAAFQQTALMFKAAYLAAGKQFAEADAAGRAAIELITARFDGPNPRGDGGFGG